MTNSQKNKLSMFLAVLGIMDKYDGAWSALTAIADMVTRLTDLVAAIQTNSGIQGTPRDGVAQGKNRKQVAMIQQTLAVAGDLHAFAVKTGDDVLAGQTDVEWDHLAKLEDNLIAPRCRELYTLAQANAAALAGYGTTAADLTALDAAIGAYEPVANAPRVATSQNVSVTADIGQETRDAMALVRKELDPAMRKFKTKNVDFFHAYHDARVIVDLGVVHEKKSAAVTPPAVH